MQEAVRALEADLRSQVSLKHEKHGCYFNVEFQSNQLQFLDIISTNIYALYHVIYYMILWLLKSPMNEDENQLSRFGGLVSG